MTDEEIERRRQKSREYSRRYRERHPERVKASQARQAPEKRRAIDKRYRERHREKVLAKLKDYYWTNKENRQEARREWGRANKERLTANQERWKTNNPGRTTELNREWIKANRGRYNAFKSRRRKYVREATPPWVDMAEIARIYENCPEGYHVDHKHPIIGKNFRGLHVPWNLQYLPAFDNRSKGNRLCHD